MQLSRYENGEAVCMVCGIVVNSDAADSLVERSLEIETREGSHSHDPKSLSTRVWRSSRGEPDASTTLTGRDKKHLLEMWWRSARVSDESEKKLALAFAEITRVAIILSLPIDVIERASLNYKMTAEGRHIQGRNIRTLSAAALYLACKQCGFAVTLNQIVRASGISKKKIGYGYRVIVKNLGCLVPPTKPSQYLQNLLDNLAPCEMTKLLIGRILKVADELKLTGGRNPSGILAAACYIASLLTGEKKTQREISEATRVTEATIRNRYNEIRKHLLFILCI